MSGVRAACRRDSARHSDVAPVVALATRGGAAIATLTLVLLGVLRASPAAACSPPPGWDPIADSAIIIEGVVTGWAIDPAGAPERIGQFDQLTLDVRLAVDFIYRGAPPELFDFSDRSLVRDRQTNGTHWTGGSGDCTVFPEDPTGLRLVAAFEERGGAWATDSPRLFYLEPRRVTPGSSLEAARTRLIALGPPRPTAGYVARRWRAALGWAW